MINIRNIMKYLRAMEMLENGLPTNSKNTNPSAFNQMCHNYTSNILESVINSFCSRKNFPGVLNKPTKFKTNVKHWCSYIFKEFRIYYPTIDKTNTNCRSIRRVFKWFQEDCNILHHGRYEKQLCKFSSCISVRLPKCHNAVVLRLSFSSSSRNNRLSD